MKVLLIGGGGREHALGWKLAQSPLLSVLYVAPGNPGLNRIGAPCSANPSDNEEIIDWARANDIDLIVVGPEAPLALGLGDAAEAAGLACFGASKAAAQLEASKAFTKEICAAVGAPTAAHTRFTDSAAAKAHLADMAPPYVIKADGLAAGKGVVIADTRAEAAAAVDDMLGGKYGAAGAEILIEEFMTGEEASFFAICDGENVLPMIAAQDHKRAFDGDRGPNTGGMGAYAPAPVFTPEMQEQTMARIIRPVVAEMKRRGTPFRGVLYAGLMLGADGPRLVEFNVRFGDPECQVLMPLLDGDLLPILHAAATGDLDGRSLAWKPGAAASVVLATKGYPGAYEKGSPIRGVEAAEAGDGVVVFHAGTKEADRQDDDQRLRANGGRVLNVTATGADLTEALRRAYGAVDKIDWPEGYCRRDIGARALGGAERGR